MLNVLHQIKFVTGWCLSVESREIIYTCTTSTGIAASTKPYYGSHQCQHKAWPLQPSSQCSLSSSFCILTSFKANCHEKNSPRKTPLTKAQKLQLRKEPAQCHFQGGLPWLLHLQPKRQRNDSKQQVAPQAAVSSSIRCTSMGSRRFSSSQHTLQVAVALRQVVGCS